MVPGHTKFGPDLVARAQAGQYNSSDVFNQNMLLQCIQKYAAGQVYDEKGLFHWKKATDGLFKAIDSITQYSYFNIVADDGELDVGVPQKLPDGLEDFPGDAAPLYSEASVRLGAQGVAKRSLNRIVRASIAGKLSGGIGGGAASDAPPHLMPDKVEKARRLRLFMKRTPGEEVVREQVNWMIVPPGADVTEIINSALDKLKPYATTPDAGKEFYGPKLKGIADQYGRYVPPKHIPDEFNLLPGGQAQGIYSGGRSRQLSIMDYAVANTPAVAAASGKSHRWKASRDEALLRNIIDDKFDGVVPRASSDVKCLAELMPVADVGCSWDGAKLRKRAVALQKERNRATS